MSRHRSRAHGLARQSFGAFTIVSACISFALLPVVPAHAEPATEVRASYKVNLGGFTVGRLKLEGTVSADRYDLNGSGTLSGLPQLFTDFSGRTSSSGQFKSGRIYPSAHAIRYNTIKKDYTTDMAFSGRNVSRIALDPPLKRKRSRVPVEKAHSKGVIDPLSAAIAPLPAGVDPMSPGACNRRLPIFDGRERFDVAMSFKTIGRVRAAGSGGYAGPVLVCRLQYVPIAGHRREDKFMDRLRKTDDIELWFAPIPSGRALVLYRAKVPTPLGWAVVFPKTFGFRTTGTSG